MPDEIVPIAPEPELTVVNPDSGWERFPEAKIRMRENGLKLLLESLSKGGFCLLGTPRIELLPDGIYIEILTNVGKAGSHIVALPLEVFIPI